MPVARPIIGASHDMVVVIGFAVTGPARVAEGGGSSGHFDGAGSIGVVMAKAPRHIAKPASASVEATAKGASSGP